MSELDAVRAISSGRRMERMPADVHDLIGLDGPGKSTLIGCISGVRIDAGEIAFRGLRIDRMSVYRRARLDIARTNSNNIASMNKDQ